MNLDTQCSSFNHSLVNAAISIGSNQSLIDLSIDSPNMKSFLTKRVVLYMIYDCFTDVAQ